MKRLIAAALFTLTLVVGLAADEKTAVWERIYRNSLNDEMRYSVMLNIKELHDKSFGNLLTDAISDLLARHLEQGDNNEVDSKIKLATLVVQELGEIKEAGAADQVFAVFQEVKKHPFLKAEAAMALGKMRATDYAAPLSRALADINVLAPKDNQSDYEIVAFGLVQALAIMKDARGYEPMFFASIGWYSPARKVRETSKNLLKNMVDDPTDSLLTILKGQTNFVNKLRALEAEDDSKAPGPQKAKVALAGLEDGVRAVPANIVESVQLNDLRKKALAVLMANQDKSPQAVPLYRLQYGTAVQTKDSTEVLTLLQALGVNGTGEAVQFLAELIAKFNERQSAGVAISDFEIQQFRTILQSIKAAGNPAARPALMEAQYMYTPALQRDIKAVLASLPNN